jgi:uncharacterized protein YjbJ (UPF0337 family)
MAFAVEANGLFCGRVEGLLLTWESLYGIAIDRSAGAVGVWRRRLGIYALAASLARCASFKSIGGSSEMKSGTENRVEGVFHEVKGKIKEETGKLADKPELEAEGTVEKIAGKMQNKFGHVQKAMTKD